MFEPSLCLNECHWWVYALFLGVFEDDEITHIEGEVNPVRDMEIIFEELRLKDEDYLRRQVDQMEKSTLRSGDKSKQFEYVSGAVSISILTDATLPVFSRIPFFPAFSRFFSGN